MSPFVKIPHQRATAFSLCAVMLVAATSARAGVAVPAVSPNVDCKISSTYGNVCGLYMDFTGSATASSTGGQSFSYQPSWTYTPYRFVDEAPIDSSGGSLAVLHATDFVTFGALKSQLAATSTTSGWSSTAPHTAARSDSYLAFQDRLTFNLAGVPAGTLGTMIGRMTVSGAVGSSPASYPFTTTGASASVYVNSISPIAYSVNAYGDRPSAGGIPSVITFELPVKFNDPNYTLLVTQLLTSVNTAALNQMGTTWVAAADANFFSSVEWAGIDSVLDAQGNPVTGWSVSSASGFDYSRSYVAQVPEPSDWAMMTVGLALLVGLRKHSPVRSRGVYS
jgi:hypothetical protein